MPPDSSFNCHISLRIITRADSISSSARFATTAPIAVIARHFIDSSLLQRKEKSGLITWRARNLHNSFSLWSKLSDRIRSSTLPLRFLTPCLEASILFTVSISLLHCSQCFLKGLYNQKARSGFQTFHTFPTKSGPGLRTVLPGCQPEGHTSLPFVSLTC